MPDPYRMAHVITHHEFNSAHTLLRSLLVNPENMWPERHIFISPEEARRRGLSGNLVVDWMTTTYTR